VKSCIATEGAPSLK
jgi:hypothetical protein